MTQYKIILWNSVLDSGIMLNNTYLVYDAVQNDPSEILYKYPVSIVSQQQYIFYVSLYVGVYICIHDI
jgi:hypothetical protein